jgi:hypothetical protein
VTNKLDNPQSLAFDIDGNLYVSDASNHRVQMFMLIENPPCSSVSSGNLNSCLFIRFVFFNKIFSIFICSHFIDS